MKKFMAVLAMVIVGLAATATPAQAATNRFYVYIDENHSVSPYYWTLSNYLWVCQPIGGFWNNNVRSVLADTNSYVVTVYQTSSCGGSVVTVGNSGGIVHGPWANCLNQYPAWWNTASSGCGYPANTSSFYVSQVV